jgi:hypothetical protein
MNDPSPEEVLTPVAVAGISDAVHASVRSDGSGCAALTDGTVRCWVDTTGSTPVDGVTGATSIAAALGSDSSTDATSPYACVTTITGDVMCWGSNGAGQLGNGTTTSSPSPSAVKGDVADAVFVDATIDRVCALTSHGTVSCWGGSSVFAQEVRVSGAVALSLSGYGECAAQHGGFVTCWNVCSFRSCLMELPQHLGGLGETVSLSMGGAHGCVMAADSSVQCWGNNDHGELGGEGLLESPRPVTATVLKGFGPAIGLSANEDQTCAVNDAGLVRCWGVGSDEADDTPGLDAAAVSVGESETCALARDRTVTCWATFPKAEGYDHLPDRGALAKVNGLTDVVELSLGLIGCALLADATVKCWNGPYESPAAVPGLTGITRVEAWGYFGGLSCGIDGKRQVLCWNFRDNVPPTRVPSTDQTVGLSMTEGRCTTSTNGPVYCWLPDDPTARPVATTDGAMALSPAGLSNVCAILADSTVTCWDDTAMSTSPIQPKPVRGITGATAVVTGRRHSCALLKNGDVMCWGDNRAGQLGTGSHLQSFSATPILVAGL